MTKASVPLFLALFACASSSVGAQGFGFRDASSVVGLWEDATEATIGTTAEYTNGVELADVDGDGRVDILFASGGGYKEPEEAEFSRVFLNRGPEEEFEEATEQVLGPEPMVAARAIRVADVNDDGRADIAVGTSYGTQSRLYLGDGGGAFRNVTGTHVPQISASVGDLKFGDVDGDADLDLALADWGPGNPMENAGGRTLLWLNDGSGRFTDATDERMPETLVRFSWNLELVDVDNDFDLDLMISSKRSPTSFLFENDGSGNFTDVTEGRVPPYTNNYEIEAIDLTADGYLDVITMNDGEHLEDQPYARRNHIFVNDGSGGFVDASPDLWPDHENLAVDDNVAVMLDYDSDGDADVLVASLQGPDRMLINDGSGHLRLGEDFMNSFKGGPTLGTLGAALADLNGDRKLDAVQAQGEVPGYEDERVFFGKSIPVDSASPVIALVEEATVAGGNARVRARVHDNKTPVMPHDWQSVTLRWVADGETQETPMKWYGEQLWTATAQAPSSGSLRYQVCAVDLVGNKACSLEMEVR